jgi:iron complex outermembrane receptor protein
MITLPEYFGIANTIRVGALIAKETSPTSAHYDWGTSEIPQTAANLVSSQGVNTFDGGVQRTIYQGYMQDKIDLVQNTLHVTPG